MTRNWRAYGARVQYYFNEGNNALMQAKQVVYVSAALNLLGVPLLIVVALAPVIFALHVLAGWLWIRHGWYKQLTEVPSVDAVAPIQMWDLHMRVRLYEKMGLPINGVDLTTVPHELAAVLSSFHPEKGTS